MVFLILCFYFHFVHLGRVENTSQNLSNNVKEKNKEHNEKKRAENKEMSNFEP